MIKQESVTERDLLIFRSMVAICIISGISLITITIIDIAYGGQYQLLFNILSVIFFISLMWCVRQFT